MKITTEEAELHRNQIEEVRLLRLAAERDALRAENARLREALQAARRDGLEEAARVAKGFEGNDHLWSQHRWPLDDAWESASQAADIIAAAIRALEGSKQ
jgi:hypothetical protein